MEYPSPSPKKQKMKKTLSQFLRLRSNASSSPSTSSSPSLESSPCNIVTSLEAMDSLISELFASVSSIKASYAQFQQAQTPYDPALIQSSDLGIVAELRHVSELKRDFCANNLVSKSPLESQITEQQNLLKTYEITCKKLEKDVSHKDSELNNLNSELSQLNMRNDELETMVFPGKTVASLDGLHLSGLNAMHFLCALRFAVKSIRNFVNLMVKQMVNTGWDLDSASKAINPAIVLQDSSHLNFSFESFVCNVLFSDFHKKDFNLEVLQERTRWKRDKFFNEFTSLKSLTFRDLVERNYQKDQTIGFYFKQFLRAKYLTLVHPNMELSFFDNLDHRETIKQGFEFPISNWFKGFAEMARRVYLLHCLFFSFQKEMNASIFQVRKGTRFSEVYMESVVPVPVLVPVPERKVGFTVVPGFKIGLTVVQSRVYLSQKLF